MPLTLLLASALLLQGQGAAPTATEAKPEPVELTVIRKPGEKLAYQVRSHLLIESRGGMMDTWFPEELDLNYDFNIEVQKEKADGIVDARYKRPTMTQIEGETVDGPPQETVEKVNVDLQLTVSPINEILSIADLAAKKPNPKKTPAKKGGKSLRVFGAGTGNLQVNFLGQFIGEIYRLSLFTGSLDSALDLAPKLPVEAVSVGDTWKRTVGYSPQKLKGKGGKQAVQRLDYTYTYKGVMDVNGRMIHRIDGDLALDTDLAEFFHQLTELKPQDTGLRAMKMKLKSKIEFDLDYTTRKTLAARATSEGGYSVMTTQSAEPVSEERLKGRTTMKLVSSK